jgi:hypothetical protein
MPMGAVAWVCGWAPLRALHLPGRTAIVYNEEWYNVYRRHCEDYGAERVSDDVGVGTSQHGRTVDADCRRVARSCAASRLAASALASYADPDDRTT